MSDGPKFLTCACKHCGQNIEFPAAGAGETVECPHCKATTRLIAPPPQTWADLAVSAASSGTSLGSTLERASSPKTHSADRPAAETTNIEDALKALGLVFLFGGCIIGAIAAVCFAATFQYSSAENRGLIGERIGLAGIAIVGMVQGVASKALFDALAEIIRLLRKLEAK